MTLAAIDCDTHYYEPLSLWSDFIDPAFRSRSPELVEEGDRLLVRIGERVYPYRPEHPGLGMVYGPDDTLRADIIRSKAVSMDASRRMELMDQGAIGTQVIYPTLGLIGFASIEDPDLAAACCRAYNRFSSEFAGDSNGRLKPAMMIPMKHPEHAAREARFAREELGLSIAFANPTPPDNRPWSNEFYAEAWATVADLDITFTFHEAAVAAGPSTLGVERYKEMPQLVYLCTHTVEPMMAISELIFGGVLKQYPALKIGMLEAHVSWIPGWLDLLDFKSQSLKAHESALGLDMRPSDYFRRQCFTAAFPDDPGIGEAMERVGEDCVVFSSDWPHNEQVADEFDDGVAFVLARTDLTAEQKQRILVDNPRKWFSIQ